MATAHSQFGEESQETRSEMANETSTQTHHVEDVEIQEWLESLDSVLEASGPDVAREILERLRAHATVNGIDLPLRRILPTRTRFRCGWSAFPWRPGIGAADQVADSLECAGDGCARESREHNIGGHISTLLRRPRFMKLASTIFGGAERGFEGDTIYFQGHAAPGMYARAFMEGRLSKEKLENFRRELNRAADCLPIRIRG